MFSRDSSLAHRAVAWCPARLLQEDQVRTDTTEVHVLSYTRKSYSRIRASYCCPACNCAHPSVNPKILQRTHMGAGRTSLLDPKSWKIVKGTRNRIWTMKYWPAFWHCTLNWHQHHSHLRTMPTSSRALKVPGAPVLSRQGFPHWPHSVAHRCWSYELRSSYCLVKGHGSYTRTFVGPSIYWLRRIPCPSLIWSYYP